MDFQLVLHQNHHHSLRNLHYNMKKIKCLLFLIIAVTYSKESVSQKVVISSAVDSCLISFNADTFLIKVVKGDIEFNDGFYNFSTFKDSCCAKLKINKIGFIANFKTIDSLNRLDSLASKMSGSEVYSYLIKKANQEKQAIPPRNGVDTTTTPNPPIGGNPKFSYITAFILFVAIILMTLLIIYRKKIYSLLPFIEKNKLIKEEESINTIIHSQDEIDKHIKNLTNEISELEKEKKRLSSQNEELCKQIKNKDNEIDKKQKAIEIKEESLKNQLNKERENYENQLLNFKNKHESDIKKIKSDFEIWQLSILEENKKLDQLLFNIYDKYKFLNDERLYNNSFDLGQIIEAAYFFNSVSKNYILKLPDLFKHNASYKFKCNQIITKSDNANLNFLFSNTVSNDVFVADEDSVKRNQDLSSFIVVLRKKIVEANINDVSSVIIDNHRIML